MDKLRCIQVRAGEAYYDIPIDRVEKVLLNPEVVPVPDSPEAILGIGIYEGEAVPFLCLQKNVSEDRVRCGVLLIAEGRGLIGIGVDEACGIREVPVSEVWEQADEKWKELWGGSQGGKADG